MTRKICEKTSGKHSLIFALNTTKSVTVKKSTKFEVQPFDMKTVDSAMPAAPAICKNRFNQFIELEVDDQSIKNQEN